MGCFLFISIAAFALKETVSHGAFADTLASLFGAVLGTLILWLLLYKRWRVPHSIWIVLGTLFVVNVMSLIGQGQFMSIALERWPDFARELDQRSLELTATSSLLALIIREQTPLLCTAALAFALRRPGPACATRRGRVILSALLICVFVLSLGAVGTFLRLGYLLSSGLGSQVAFDAGERVPLVGNLGYIDVPQGWRALVSTDAPAPPAWLLMGDDAHSGFAQSVQLFEGSATATRSMDATTVCLVNVYSSRQDWLDMRSEPSTRAVAVALPRDVLAGKGSIGHLTTREAYKGEGWQTWLRVDIPDANTPVSVSVLLRHESQGQPSTAQFVDVLRSIRLVE